MLHIVLNVHHAVQLGPCFDGIGILELPKICGPLCEDVAMVVDGDRSLTLDQRHLKGHLTVKPSFSGIGNFGGKAVKPLFLENFKKPGWLRALVVI